MLLSAQRLVDRLRHPRARADEVHETRRKLARAAADETPTDEERAVAAELRRHREAMSAAFAGVASCASCAIGYPEPHGHWAGGHCCGGRTENVFTDDEIAALAFAGTRPSDLRPPSSDMAGCAFRGPSGCSLAAGDRPSVCVRYLCRDLAEELRVRGDYARVARIAGALMRASARFEELRAERLATQRDGEMERCLRAPK
jgi:hypothetical protein